MILTFGKISEYSPITKIGDKVYKICWNKTLLYDYEYEPLTPEQEEQERNGEKVERVVISTTPSEYCTYMTEYVYGDISINNLKNIIYTYYNNITDNNILNKFVWNGMPVWLSSENQFNYKAAYDLAFLTNGLSLPVTFKFGTTLDPVYYTFNSLEEFTSFYTLTITYINTLLSEGWSKKDSIDWSQYEINE